jgi:hypothetical protein
MYLLLSKKSDIAKSLKYLTDKEEMMSVVRKIQFPCPFTRLCAKLQAQTA